MQRAEGEAYKFRSSFYQRCYNLEDIKASIANGKFVSYSFFVYSSFWDSYGDGNVPLRSLDDYPVGRHAVCIVPCDDRTENLTFANSWGEVYGHNGFGYLPYDYVREETYEAVTTIFHDDYLGKSGWHFCKHFRRDDRTALISFRLTSGYTNTHRGILVMNLYERCRLKGWLIAGMVNDHCLEIIDLFVLPKERNQGFGTLLLTRFLHFVEIRGISQVFALVSLDDSRRLGVEEATEFFRNHGFIYNHDPDAFPFSSGRIEWERTT